MKTPASLATLALATAAFSQNVTVPTDCGDYESGTDEVIFTVPYTYNQVMKIIGAYGNLTWSGSPEGSVTLNGTDNTVGTARTYDLMGLHIVETILTYEKPPAPGPYDEVHNTANFSTPDGSLSVFIPYDGTTVTSVCNGKASTFNFTAHFCSNNATEAGGLLHMAHLGDAETVGKFLGGMNYTNCSAFGEDMGAGPANATAAPSGLNAMGSPTATSSPAATSSGAAMKYGAGMVGGAAAVFAGVLLL